MNREAKNLKKRLSNMNKIDCLIISQSVKDINTSSSQQYWVNQLKHVIQ